MGLYVQTTEDMSTSAANWTDMSGLCLTLPEGVQTTAIVTLNVPMPYAEGTDYPGGVFGINVNGQVSKVVASFTYNEQAPGSFGRMPTTLVLGVPLTMSKQSVQAVWQGVRGSTVVLDSPATLSAVLDQG
jgi:mannose-binding lectin